MNAVTSFGQWIKQRRKTLDLTRQELARRIGCAVVTLYKIEADERRPSRQMAALLARHLVIADSAHEDFIRFARMGVLSANSTLSLQPAVHTPTNLPLQPTELIGREAITAEARALLLGTSTRLLTLTGAPGIGKTRLAIELASTLLEDFPDGVFYVALAPITDPSLVCAAIVQTLGVHDSGPQTPIERLRTALRGKRLLLVLDNFEQVLAAAPDIADLLTQCPWLTVLVTSREPLHLRHERQFPVPLLDLPATADLPDVETLAQFASVRLFVERARAVTHDFVLTDENAAATAALCRRLDGLPLAIELVSARVKLLPPAALLAQLHRNGLLQANGMHDSDPRHQTLNAAIDWSYRLLTPDEQALLCRLGIFTGGWTLEAADAVCAVGLDIDCVTGMASLLDKSLIRHDTRTGHDVRFVMLETVREYALTQLTLAGELDESRQRHAGYFLGFAERAEAHLFSGEQLVWFDRLDMELDNLRSALASSAGNDVGLRLIASLGWFLSERSYWAEGLEWFERALAASPDAPDSLRAKALQSAGALAGHLCRDDDAEALLSEALTVANRIDDHWNIAWALCHSAIYTSRPYEQKIALLEDSLDLFRELNDTMGIAHTLLRRLHADLVIDISADVDAPLDEAARLANAVGDTISMAWVLYSQGFVSRFQRLDFERARQQLERSASMFREARMEIGFNQAMLTLAGLEEALGNLDAAKERQDQLMSFWDRHSNRNYSVAVLAAMARNARDRGFLALSARLFGAVSVGRAVSPGADIPTEFQIDISCLRQALGDEAFEREWALGQSMSADQIRALSVSSTR